MPPKSKTDTDLLHLFDLAFFPLLQISQTEAQTSKRHENDEQHCLEEGLLDRVGVGWLRSWKLGGFVGWGRSWRQSRPFRHAGLSRWHGSGRRRRLVSNCGHGGAGWTPSWLVSGHKRGRRRGGHPISTRRKQRSSECQNVDLHVVVTKMNQIPINFRLFFMK